jgi:uncharacterized protein (DUF58 family)
VSAVLGSAPRSDVLVAVGLVALGLWSGATGLVVVGLLVVTTGALRSLWSQRGTVALSYRRELGAERAVWGDRIPLTLTVANAKLLPLAWLRVDDYVSDELVVEPLSTTPTERPGIASLRTTWSLAPYEEVRRHATIVAERRGRFRFESVALTVADLFGRSATTVEQPLPATLIVRPRTVPVQVLGPAALPFGPRRIRQGLVEDPALFAGVRPFQRGDPRRRVHERATARLGRPVSKRFEPSAVRDVVIALDIQTLPGPIWRLQWDDDLVEGLAVAAGSLARRILDDGSACGLAVNAWTYQPDRIGFVAPRAGPGQLARLLDLLGRMSPVPSIPAGRMLGAVARRIPAGSLVVTMSGRDPSELGPALRRLRASGFELLHVAVGREATAHAATARRLGVPVRVAGLAPDWRRCDVLELVA